MTLALAGGTVAAEGEIALRDADAGGWLPSPRLALALDARGIDVQRLLGVGFAQGSLSFHAGVRGTPDDLALDVGFSNAGSGLTGLTVLGEAVELPAHASLRLGGFGAGHRIAAAGRARRQHAALLRPHRHIRTAGPRRRRARLPNRAAPRPDGRGSAAVGRDSGAVRIAGEPRAPAVSGNVTFTNVTFRNEPLGGGTLTVTPERGGAIRARGHLIEAIAVDGSLVPRPSGLEGAVTLTLNKLRLDPFLPRLPLAIAAGGVTSGTLAARIAPGKPAMAEGRLSELSVTLQVPVGRRAKSFRPLSMHAEGDIKMTVHSDEGLSLSAARLRGDIGAFELSANSRGDDIDARLRGRIELDALAPFTRRWLDQLQGALDVDVSASRVGATGRIDAKGTAAVAAPISGAARGHAAGARRPGRAPATGRRHDHDHRAARDGARRALPHPRSCRAWPPMCA